MPDAGIWFNGRLTYRGLKYMAAQLEERGHALVVDVATIEAETDCEGKNVWRATCRMHDSKLPNAHEAVVDEPVFKPDGRMNEFATKLAVAKAHRNALRVLVPPAMHHVGGLD